MFFLRRRRSERSSRGQALVETAFVLPILALLMVMALDFGRVFFGWIALQNAARIGADFAAQTSTAWDGLPAEEQLNRDRYVQLVEDDVNAINCTLADGGVIPDPTFEDGLDAPSPDTAYDDGDYALVRLECSFGLITPLAETILGGPVALGAQEKFPVNRHIVQGIPEPPPEPPECIAGDSEVPDMVTETLEDALDMWIASGFAEANFDPEVIDTGPPSGRNNTDIVIDQSIDPNECVPPTSPITLTLQP